MKTYNLVEAAALLHMSPSALREKAKRGEIRASKPGKRWVFLLSDIEAYLQEQADLVAAKAAQLVVKPCRSINVDKSIGFDLRRRADSEYASLLRLPTGAQRKNSTTS